MWISTSYPTWPRARQRVARLQLLDHVPIAGWYSGKPANERESGGKQDEEELDQSGYPDATFLRRPALRSSTAVHSFEPRDSGRFKLTRIEFIEAFAV